jgi:putative endonuclease
LSAERPLPTVTSMAAERRQLGFLAEERAAQHVRQHGFAILARNFRCRSGELDIVARREGLLVIAEVRVRSSGAYGGAAASITRVKQARIRRASRYFLLCRPALANLSVRFDTLLLERLDGPINWIENAFT